jgi:transposase InsO family protein
MMQNEDKEYSDYDGDEGYDGEGYDDDEEGLDIQAPGQLPLLLDYYELMRHASIRVEKGVYQKMKLDDLEAYWDKRAQNRGSINGVKTVDFAWKNPAKLWYMILMHLYGSDEQAPVTKDPKSRLIGGQVLSLVAMRHSSAVTDDMRAKTSNVDGKKSAVVDVVIPVTGRKDPSLVDLRSPGRTVIDVVLPDPESASDSIDAVDKKVAKPATAVATVTVKASLHEIKYWTALIEEGVWVEAETKRLLLPLEYVLPLVRLMYTQPDGVAGRDNIYERLKGVVLISIRRVNRALKQLAIWQLHRPILNVSVFPLRVQQMDRPNQRWQIDLIEMPKPSASNPTYKLGLSSGSERTFHAQFEYVLTCVDLFSRRAWTKTLRNKTALAVAKGLKQILDSEQKHWDDVASYLQKLFDDPGAAEEASMKRAVLVSFLPQDWLDEYDRMDDEQEQDKLLLRFTRDRLAYPTVIQSDNGSEFIGLRSTPAREVLLPYVLGKTPPDDMTDDHVFIRQIFSIAHNPHTQGGIERFNQTYKRKFFPQYIVGQTTTMTPDAMEKALDNYNFSVHKALGSVPFEVHYGLDTSMLGRAEEKMTKQSRKTQRRGNRPYNRKLQNGDYVRISILTDNKMRRIDNGLKRKVRYKRNWEFGVYQVSQVIKVREMGSIQLPDDTVPVDLYQYRLQTVFFGAVPVHRLPEKSRLTPMYQSLLTPEQVVVGWTEDTKKPHLNYQRRDLQYLEGVDWCDPINHVEI